jgi:hypothetical protein
MLIEIAAQPCQLAAHDVHELSLEAARTHRPPARSCSSAWPP